MCPFQAAPAFTMQVNNDSIRVQSSSDRSQGVPTSSEKDSDDKALSTHVASAAATSGTSHVNTAAAKSAGSAEATGSKRKQSHVADGGGEFKRMRVAEF